MRDNRFKGSFRSEGAYMKLIKYIVPKRQTKPMLVAPWEELVEHFRRSMDAFWLETRSRIRTIGSSIKPVRVASTRLDPGKHGLVVSMLRPAQNLGFLDRGS